MITVGKKLLLSQRPCTRRNATWVPNQCFDVHFRYIFVSADLSGTQGTYVSPSVKVHLSYTQVQVSIELLSLISSFLAMPMFLMPQAMKEEY